jgi:hypothetical protein
MLSDYCALILIAGLTLIGAISGLTSGSVASVFAEGANKVIIILLSMSFGATIGFVIGALPAALLFTLSEIAENTKNTSKAIDMLLRANGKSAGQSSIEDSRPRSLVYLKDSEVLSEESLETLKRAKAAGYNFKKQEDGTIVLTKEGAGTRICNSNSDIIQFRKFLPQHD